MTGFKWWVRAVSLFVTQCMTVAAVSATSSTLAMTHTTVAAARRPATCRGRVAAALATIPVPMTDAYQFGVMFRNMCIGCSSSRISIRDGVAGRTAWAVDMLQPSSSRGDRRRPLGLWGHKQSLWERDDRERLRTA
jgi:hypothetical protein